MATTTETTPPDSTTYEFQAETRKLLDLMIHSLYSHKEIFLRELISNASDALDRLRFEALTEEGIELGDEELSIKIEADPKGRTLTISDNGIGMSREEVIENIGTIARSGTRELAERLKAARKEGGESIAQLIGQFGVGFYSSFMVADRVELVTRRAGSDTAVRWESEGAGEYRLAEAERESRGTTITLHLKPEDEEHGLEDFTDEYVLKRIIRRYSDFVTHPIQLKTSREEVERDEEGKPKEETRKTVTEEVTVNSRVPLWAKNESEVTEEEYAEFYKHISHDWGEPMEHIAVRAEGRFEYQALLFIPESAPYDLFYVGHEPGLQLYVKRVMIMERSPDLLPRYLRFVKGVVDSPDLPLNVSREMLQNDRMIRAIKKNLVKKMLDKLTEIKESDRERYVKFWGEFGRAIKEGLTEDFENKERLTALALFQSSHEEGGEEKLTTLAEYVSRMKEEQKEIYYLTGESRDQVESSPHLEAFKERGYEVLYLVDTVDELLVQYLTEFDGKKLKSVGKGTVDLGDEKEREERKKELEAKEEEFKTLTERLQKELDAHVKHVRLSNRLTTSPACLVGAEHDYSPQLEKILQKGKGGGPKQRRILELNPEHPVVTKMREHYAEEEGEFPVGHYAQLLFGYATVAEGSELLEPVQFNQAVAELMAKTL